MSMRFNLCSGGLLVASVIGGLTIGSYATRVPVSEAGAPYSTDLATAQDSAASDAAADTAPRTIVCKGCGPTLAERRMAADQASLDADSYISGSRDPVVVDYMQAQVAEAAPPPPPPQMLPVAAQRFIDSPVAPPPAARTISATPPAIGQP